MALPGNITIGYLEEDIPQKAFFRIKPLFIKGDGAFEPVENAKELFPDQGGIRIVPDKNESSRFKARMRTLGRYCVVDLSRHTTENDKIRPNKNYNPDRTEFNRNIIYSDVVAKCPDDWISEVVRAEAIEDGVAKATLPGRPGTRHVTVIQNGAITGPWLVSGEEGENKYTFAPDESYETYSADESTYMRLFTVSLSEGRELEVIVSANGAPLYTRKSPVEAAKSPAEEATPATETEAPAPAPESPTAEEAPAEPAHEPSLPESEEIPEKPAESADSRPASPVPPVPPRPVKPESDASVRPAPAYPPRSAKTEAEIAPRPAPAYPPRPVKPEADINARPAPAYPQRPFKPEADMNARPAIPPRPAKPEADINACPPPAPQAPARSTPDVPPIPERPPRPEADIYPRPSMRAPFAGQTGLNPRRGRSLSEIIDDFWRKSRIDQLGAPIPGNAGGQPVLSPIERATESAKEAWALPEARASLIDGLIGMEGFSEALAPRFGHGSVPATSEQMESLNSLEEERLKILGEIDDLRRQRIEKRAELMQEAREAHAEQVKEMEEEIELLKQECDARLRAAEDARKAQSNVQKSLGDENELLKFVLNSRAAGLIREWEGVDEKDFAASPETYEPNGAQLVSDVRSAFENCGYALENDDAVNLLACLAISPFTVISGPTGCGKTDLVRKLASALGLTGEGQRRFISLPNGPKPAREVPEFKALTRYEDKRTLRVVLLDDANQYPAIDVTRGLMNDSEEKGENSSLRVILTVLDDQLGFPLNPRLLDRGFTVRMKMPDAADWNAVVSEMPCAARAASLSAIRSIFKGDGDIPGEVEARLNTLLSRLQALGIRLSRRCLRDMRVYCASAAPLMNASPKKVLDYAFAQRALPAILASAKMNVLRQLPDILCDLPMSLSLLKEPLPLPPI